MRFANFITTLGFKATRFDASLFVLRQGLKMAFLLLYVDGMTITASSNTML